MMLKKITAMMERLERIEAMQKTILSMLEASMSAKAPTNVVTGPANTTQTVDLSQTRAHSLDAGKKG